MGITITKFIEILQNILEKEGDLPIYHFIGDFPGEAEFEEKEIEIENADQELPKRIII